MAKESMGDRIVDKLHKRRDVVRARLAEQYKNTKPFRMELVNNDELLYYYNQLSPDDMNYLVQTHGEDKMNDFIYQLETLKQKRGGKG